MAFRDDLATDRDTVFLNTDEFGETLAYRIAATGVSANIPVHWEDAGDTILSDGAVARISAGDVAAPAKGDETTRGGAVYHVTFVTEEEGVFTLTLEREELIT